MNYIYELLNDGETVYVGRSKNIKRRIQQHKYEKKKVFDSYNILYEVYDLQRAKDIEDMFIMRKDPIYNKSLNSCGKYISIKEKTKGKKYDISKLLHLVKLYDVVPIFNDKYKDYTILIILKECEVE